MLPKLKDLFEDEYFKKINKETQAVLKKSGQFITKHTSNIDINVMFTFFSLEELLKWSEKITKSAASIYDRALDKEYLMTHIGGGNHRMFDKGHDIFSAWDVVKDAKQDDIFAQEVIGYFSALWKDLTTAKGLPFATWDKVNYEQMADWTVNHIPGASKDWIYDLMSFDAFEILGSALSVVGAIFALKREDMDKLSELLGSVGIISVISANPIMGIMMIGVATYAYAKKKKEFNPKEFGKGMTIALTSTALFTILGLPVLIELIVVLCVCRILRKHLDKEIDVIEVMTKFFNVSLKPNVNKAYNYISKQTGETIKNISQKAIRSKPLL